MTAKQQLTLDYVGVMDHQAELWRQDSKRRNQDAHLKSCVDAFPPENEEWDIILMGIRLARHVHFSECDRCKLDTKNHCPDALGLHWSDRAKQYTLIKVCLKDYFRWCVQHGLKSWVREWMER